MPSEDGAVYVGLDCGGSSTRVIATDGAGKLLFQGQSGAANLISTPEGRLRRNLRHATDGCPPPRVACGCFAGLIDDAARQRALAFLGELFPIARLRAEPDYVAALFAAEGADVCVVAGTGSLVCSPTPEGIVKSGGRGYILGDEGSGFVFGREATRWFLRHRKEASPTLVRAMEETFGSLVESDIVTAVHKAPSPASVLGKLARVLAIEAQDGAPYALAAVERGMGELAAIAADHIRRHLPERGRLTVALSGGVWRASALYRRAFIAALESELPKLLLDVIRMHEPPVTGAVKLARMTND